MLLRILRRDQKESYDDYYKLHDWVQFSEDKNIWISDILGSSKIVDQKFSRQKTPLIHLIHSSSWFRDLDFCSIIIKKYFLELFVSFGRRYIFIGRINVNVRGKLAIFHTV